MSGLPPLEDFLARSQHFVQRFLKISGPFGKWLSHLGNILFEALFDLLSKELLERAITKPLGMLCRMIGDDVGDKSPRQSFRALVRILGEKRVERATCPAVADCGRCSGWRRDPP